MDFQSPLVAPSSLGSPSNSIFAGGSVVADSPASTVAAHDTPLTTTSAGHGGADGRAPPPTVPAACLACRGKHLKCDGQNPCSRCMSSSSECIYVASRRGYKGPRRSTAPAHNPNKRMASSSPPPPPSRTSGAALDTCPMLLGTAERNSSASGASINGIGTGSTGSTGHASNGVGVNGNDAGASTAMPTSVATFNPAIVLPQTPGPGQSFTAASTPNLDHLQLYRPIPNGMSALNGSAGGIDGTSLVLSQHNGAPAHVQPMPTLAQRAFDAFYHYFHAAHPFVLPRQFFERLAKDDASGANLEPLSAAMRYVGSLYLENGGPTRAMFLDEALRLAYEPTTPKDGFLVQAFLLLVLGLDGSGQQEKARQVLGDAERVAVQIALNTRPFATVHGRGVAVIEESWRRTWWDLFVVDGMVAGVHRQTNFLLFDIPSDVALPCEEHQYLSGTIPLPMYLEDLEDREFSGEEREFSSFAYRVAAAQTLGKFMRCPPILGPDDANVTRIEALLTNWRMHLPQAKRDALTKHGQLDEMMFQALMMTHATSILLHQPHSQLDTSPVRNVDSCAPHRAVPSGADFNTHTRHTIASANEISRMVTHRVPLLSHTHFFTCVVTLSSIVHLSKWALYFIPHDDDDLRQQIRLNIGALNALSGVWKSASIASGQVKGVAQEIYHVKKSQQTNPVYWVGFTQEEMIQSIASDETIMNEIETLQQGGSLLPG